MLFLSSFGSSPPVLHARIVGEAAGAPGCLEHLEVRVGVLIDRHTVHVIPPDAEVQRQPIVHAPVVLDVERVEVEFGMLTSAAPPLIETCVNGPVQVVRCHRVGVFGDCPLLNVMNRCGSWMKLTPALKSWPRPPIPPMLQEKSLRNCHFFCCGLLRCVGVLRRCSRRSGRSVRIQAVGADRVAKSAYWKMNSFNFDPPSTQLWFTLIELKEFSLVPHDRSAASPQLRAVRLRVGVPAVAHRQVLLRVICVVHLARSADSRGTGVVKTPSWSREQPERVDDLQRVLLRPLERDEEVRTVAGDRPANRAAVLLAAVVLLVEVADRFRCRFAVQRAVAEHREPAALVDRSCRSW